jgi:flavin reductase (DIM6/NTAB) family NADH-FMN oxidoreductase RutF
VPIEGDQFRRLLGYFPTGVTVVTAIDHRAGGPNDTADAPKDAPTDVPWGTTVNAFSSLSLDPPLVLIAIGRERSIHPIIRASNLFAVNILAEDAQALSDCFAGAPVTPSRAEFCGAPYHLGPLGMPILDDAVAAFECRLQTVHDAGDHSVFIGRVESAEDIRKPALPLVYFRGRYLRIERAESEELLGKPEK